MLKKLITFLFATLATAGAFAQGYPPKINSYGTQNNRSRADSAQHLPHKYQLQLNTNDTTPQIFAWTTSAGDSLVLFVNGRYIIIGAGGLGGVSTFNGRSGAVTLSMSDVLTALGYAPLAPTDTPTMLAPYLRLNVAQASFYPLSSNPAGYITSNGLPNVVNSLQVINAGGAVSWSSGTYASRPSAGIAGRFYAAPDSARIYIDNGSAWLSLGEGGGTPSIVWGGITGTLSSQTDLQNALNLKLSVASNLSDLNSASSARTNLGLGTSAVKDVPASGNASSVQVVLGSDTRLSDSRSPSGSAGGSLTGTYPNPTLSTPVSSGSCTNCNVTFNAEGRATGYSNGAGGSGGAIVDTIQTITARGATTITNGVNLVRIDPSLPLDSVTLTLPTRPNWSNRLTITGGKSIAVGNTVVGFLTLTPNSGQTITRKSAIGYFSSGDAAIIIKYISSNWDNEN